MTISTAPTGWTAERLREHSLAVILAAQAPSGAFIASPSFEQYAYAWLRDGAFVAETLATIGRPDDATRFHAWLGGVVLAGAIGIERSIAAGRRGEIPQAADYLHCRYTLDGEVGKAAWPGFQLDGPGIWIWSLSRHAELGLSLPDRALEAAALTARYLAALWDTPSYDAWEENPDRVHTSTLAAILAGFRGAHRLGVADWVVDAAAADVERRLRELGREYGWLPKWAGNPAVDGSLLWLGPLYGVLDADDPLWTGTLERIESELLAPDGGVHRYRADTYYGGGDWLLLTASLGFAHLGRAKPYDRQRAEAGRRWLEAQADQDGNLPEQVACHALAPDRIAEWIAMWGPSANPLIWSHAWYLRLAAALEAGN